MMTPARKEIDTTTYRGRCAARLKCLREKSGMSVEEVAEACGITATTVYHWERAHSEPKQNMLPILAKAFGVKSPRSILAAE